jgi:hypothetical protein
MAVTSPGSHEGHDGCYLCGLNYEFDLPAEIVEAARKESLLIFAGAGISTEVPSVFPDSLYREIAGSLGKDVPQDESFPKVMQEFEKRVGRSELIREIWSRLDYVNSFPFLRGNATKFHVELATMPYIKNIVTTNWDRYFEEECAAVPFVTGEDYALDSLAGRKVYKIHGSIDSISSIVATSADYQACLVRLNEGALGGTLRHLLSTSVTVFVGYSLADDDFRTLYEALMSDMGRMRPRHFAVGPFASEAAVGLGITEIVTDGTYFLHKLKDTLVREDRYLPDEIYGRTAELRRKISLAYKELYCFPCEDNPGLVYAYSYIDGMRDGCDRISARRRSGEYSDAHALQHRLNDYEGLLESALRKERYFDAAYIEGYLNVLTHLLCGESSRWRPSLWFCFTEREIHDLGVLQTRARNLKRRCPAAWRAAVKVVDHLGPGNLPIHSLFLDGLIDAS